MLPRKSAVFILFLLPLSPPVLRLGFDLPHADGDLVGRRSVMATGVSLGSRSVMLGSIERSRPIIPRRRSI